MPDLAAPYGAPAARSASRAGFEIAGHFDIEERELFPILSSGRRHGRQPLDDSTGGDTSGRGASHRVAQKIRTPVWMRLTGARCVRGLDLCERLDAHAHKEEIAMLPALETVLDDERDGELIAAYANGR
jgi:hypothetical protein